MIFHFAPIYFDKPRVNVRKRRESGCLKIRYPKADMNIGRDHEGKGEKSEGMVYG